MAAQLVRDVRAAFEALVTGESDTGKELTAQEIHSMSLRKDKPLVSLDCSALAPGLLESELFGHVKGSFTGAVDNRTGRFEAAHTGSIFLDEINSTSPKLQVKLLRVLQEGEIERLGGKSHKIDIRLVAAFHDPEDEAGVLLRQEALRHDGE